MTRPALIQVRGEQDESVQSDLVHEVFLRAFSQAASQGFQLPGKLYRCILGTDAFEIVVRGAKPGARKLRQGQGGSRTEFRMGVDPGPDRRAPQRQSACSPHGTANPLDVRADLLRPAPQLLAERDRHGVHQMALIVPKDRENCWLRVEDQFLHWDEGSLFVFDDTYRHEVKNNTSEQRVVLILHFDRPMDWFCRVTHNVLIAIIRQTPFVKKAVRSLAKWEGRFREHTDASQ